MNLNDRNIHTKRTDPEQNPHYPRFVTDRVDQLLEELDAEQIMRLYSELKTMSYVSWNGWFLENKGQIAQYDDLSDAQRQKILSGTPSIEQLLSHHGCVFVELVRARADYQHQLKHSDLLKTDLGQRWLAMMMIDAYEAWHPADLWAFDHPDIHDHPLFADDD